MRWWSRVLRGRQHGESQGEVSSDSNVLVISDIHLGEDILSEGPAHLAEHIRALNEELGAFVAYHREHVVDGRRWQLVIDGDMFDFVKVSLRPQGDEPGPEAPVDSHDRDAAARNGSEGRYLPNTPEHVVWKLERIVEIHRPLFRELAHFVLDGHSISIVEGNHDAEFYFGAVQDTLRSCLVGLAQRIHAAEKRSEPFDADVVGERLRFRAWFEALPGRYHIEHGHQYDEMCSFEYMLAPLNRAGARTLATPLSHRPMLYIGELLGDFSTHGLERLTPYKALRFAFALGPRTFWTLIKLYFVIGLQVLLSTGPRRRDELRAMAQAHQEHLRGLSQRSPYGYDTLTRLDRLKAEPAEYSVLKMVHAFYLDRFFVGGAVVLGLLPALAMDGDLQVWWSVMVMCLGLGGLWGLSFIRRPKLADTLRRAAAVIADETGSRYVVFGHSHQPEIVDLKATYGIGRFGESAYYLNSGSWVTREVLRGEEANGMTYVEITKDGAALRRWHRAGSEPAVLGRTGAAGGEPFYVNGVDTGAAKA